MKLRYLIIAVPMALLLAGCGKKGTEATAPQTSTTTTVVQVPSPTATPIPGVTAPTGSTTTSGCYRSVITSPIYSSTANGTGTGTASTWFNTASGRVNADLDLRVQLKPNGATGSTSSGGSQSYSLLSADVSLLEDGNEVSGSRITLPTQTGWGQYYGGSHNGLTVGSKSEIADFSGFLRSGHQYSFKVSNVMTDTVCKSRCNSNYYNACIAYGYSCPAYPDYNMIYQCMQQQCDVGPVQSTAGWSVTLYVETDTTPCL